MAKKISKTQIPPGGVGTVFRKEQKTGEPDPRDLLLSEHLEPDQVAALFAPYKFRDIQKADENLQLIADEPRARQILSEILPELLVCLSQSPDPDQALNFLERFTRAALNKIYLLSYLKESPHTLWMVSKLFGSSPFMAEILIRNPTYLYWVSNPRTLRTRVGIRELRREMTRVLRNFKSLEKKRNVLRVFKRKEILRIGARDLLRIASLEETMADLSSLADILIQEACEVCDHHLRQQHGVPCYRDSSGRKGRSGFTVIGMGKLGGEELNFSSDVDLVYFYQTGEGHTSGGRSGNSDSRISNDEYFKKLSQEITAFISTVTEEGYLYRVDLRLRPEGGTGPVVYPLKGVRNYYATRGQTWERLALLKARPVAGDRVQGAQFLKAVNGFIYQGSFEPGMIRDVRTVKGKIDRKMLIRGQTHLNVKLGFGGIREVEFIIQSLQAFFGRDLPAIRERNTLKTLRKLFRRKILTREDHESLSKAYIFLRDVEHKLQMVHELQTHTLPENAEELRVCALRLDYRDEAGPTAGELFLKDYRRYTGRVNKIFKEMFVTPKRSPILQAARRAGRSKKPGSRGKN